MFQLTGENGELVKVKVKSTPTTVEGQTSGATVTIYGAVTGLISQVIQV